MKVGFLQHFHSLIFVIIIAVVSLRATFVLSTNTSSNGVIRCLGKEREALLKFKHDLIDKDGSLSSWGIIKDCCKWTGIRCHNLTNNVIMLDLTRYDSLGDTLTPLRGKISPWLLQIQHLEYLDLSFNDFNHSGIPEFIGSFRRLKHLDLSYSNFSGTIPHHLGNLSELQYIRLGDYENDLLTSANLDWLSRLHSLRQLRLIDVDLTMATNWLQAINKLTQLQVLQLDSCHLPTVLIPPPSLLNASNSIYDLALPGNELSSSWIFPLLFNISTGSLSYLNLGNNNLQGPIPDAIGNLVSLFSLSLPENQFEGGLPITLGNLTSLSSLDLRDNKLTAGLFPRLELPSSLTQLDLSYNNLQGPLPDAIGNLTSLWVLDLSQNMLKGSIPQSIGSLSQLINLYLDSNHFEGMITKSNFFNLTELRELALSGVSLNFSLESVPPFQLMYAYLSGCMLGPHFPIWLKTQTKLFSLDISNAGIEGKVPDWFWEIITPKLYDLNASHNNLHDLLPDSSSELKLLQYIDLSFNHFHGSLPILPPNAFQIDLSSNKLSGPVTNLCVKDNEPITWVYLDLSNNTFSGRLPECLANLPHLEFLSLAHNNFSGKIPSLNAISSLHLQNNSFTGEIPKSLRNSTYMTFLDVSENNLSGEIPTWVGNTWTGLVFLSLRSNKFTGAIPSNVCHLQLLHVLDLSLNKISGEIPKCLSNLTAMSREVDHSFDGSFIAINGFESALLVWKGIELQYKTTLNLVKFIDLSRNNLVGDIPKEIENLVAIVGLNLSRNNLSGCLPTKIGQWRSLDFLDLSRNHLNGGIPTGLSELDQLGVLDLSYNNLSGKIPQSNHMLTFNASSFEENPGLCGPPLLKACPGDKIAQDPDMFGEKISEEEDTLFDGGFYISMAVGFAFGFWGVCGALFFNKTWRTSFFKWWDRTTDWLYVKIIISLIRTREAFHKFATS